MKIKNMNLTELREFYDNSEEFIIRIRDYQKENSQKDLVYYRGIKTLEIDNNPKPKNEVNVKLLDNVYHINEANILDARAKKYDLIKAITVLREEMKHYFILKMKPITLKKASTYQKNRETVKMHLQNIESALQQYKEFLPNFKIENILETFDNNEKKYKIEIHNNDKLTINDMVIIEYYFTYHSIIENNLYNKKIGLAKPNISFSLETKQDITKENLEEFNKKIKHAVDKYLEYVKKKEKTYQHDFMLNKMLYERLGIGLIPFEEEYCTDEAKSNNKNERGRIDCVFIKIDKDNYTLNDIYLVELKVDEGVIDGTNGIDKHLEDIKSMLENKDNFIKVLTNRVAYHLFNYQQSDAQEKITLNSENVQIHFDIVIAITNELSRKEVWKKLKDLNSTIYDKIGFLKLKNVSSHIYIDDYYHEKKMELIELQELEITENEIKIKNHE